METPELSFAEQLDRFRTTTKSYTCRGLILPGTRQPDTAALLIGALKPASVAFLLTAETQSMPQQVAALLGCDGSDWQQPAGDHLTVTQIYQALKDLLQHWSHLSPQSIAVDVTGGMKPMSVGLAKAAHVLNLTTVYVHSRAFHQNKPVPGTQYLE
ncbi:MAG: TIGR02710 family CRISPR-associated protein, partial [Chloroflexaceae bacterium]|nr:TIGR02710 family CRISPR-associated protein [Chloroflexaceae bacterium]